MKKYLIKYNAIFIFIISTFIIESLGAFIVDGSLLIKDPRYFLSSVILISTILFLIKSDKIRFYTSLFILIANGSINFIFIVMYTMTGQHFDFAMFNLVGDATGILESLPVDFTFCFILISLISLIYVFGKRIYSKTSDVNELFKASGKLVTGSLLFLTSICLNALTANSILNVENEYEKMISSNVSQKYKQYGITSSLMNELYSGLIYTNKMHVEDKEIQDFIYNQENVQSEYFGVSEGNNVVLILAETLEWFSFVSDLSIYPNGIDMTEDKLRSLFPNLYMLMDNSVVLNNNYAKEKTDVSEMYSVLGSYPKDTFVNYDHGTNTLPYSLPNILQAHDTSDVKLNSFHNGTYTYYNRNVIHNSVGFDEFYATEQLSTMFPDTFTDYTIDSQRNLDTELFNSAKDLMFYEDERFLSLGVTITMHGRYDKRDNLDELGYYDKLRSFGIDIDSPTLLPNDDEYNLYSFMATALNLDASIGVIFDDLIKKDILDETTILLYSDHNCYYQDLSKYVKGIHSTNHENYMELYRVPAFIFDTKLVNALKNNNESTYINKFTSQSDFVPTLFDILGINNFSNMYYGNSIFSEEESLAYSRSFGIFYNDKIYFENLNSILYYDKSVFTSKAMLNNYIQNELTTKVTKLVQKIQYMDQIYYYDFFSSSVLLEEFYNKMKEIN